MDSTGDPMVDALGALWLLMQWLGWGFALVYLAAKRMWE
jgi:hypothetical protein